MQLCPLPPSRPLQERFASGVFRSIPEQPGVYIIRESFPASAAPESSTP